MKHKLIAITVSILLLFLSSFAYSRTALELYQAGEEALSNNDYIVAINLFQDALDKNPNIVPCYLGIGESFFRLGNYEEALQTFNQA